MADQPIHLGGTTANDIALELWKQVRLTHGAKENIEDELKLFQQCRNAVLTR